MKAEIMYVCVFLSVYLSVCEHEHKFVHVCTLCNHFYTISTLDLDRYQLGASPLTGIGHIYKHGPQNAFDLSPDHD